MKQYSISLITGLFLLLAGIAMFNWLIDPYELFYSPNIEGINTYKVEANKHTRLAKAYQVEKKQPNVIFLASSRGLVVPKEYFSNDDETALNLALASASTYELLRYFQHAHAIRPLKRVVLALDESFTSQVQPEFSDERLSVDIDGGVNSAQRSKKLSDMINSLISLDAFKSSLRTIRKQDESPDIMSEEAYMHKRVANAGGHRQMFRKMESSIFAQGIRCDEKLSDGCSDNNEQAGQYFEKIVEIAYRDNIELIIYFSPIHARYLEALKMMGGVSDIEQMKRFVVNVVSHKAKQYGVQPFQVWDFSGYNDITTENLPDFGDVENIMTWYWEGSHYTNKTAKAVFNRMFGNESNGIVFGRRINKTSIEKHFDDIVREQKIYIATHGDYLKELEALSLLNMVQQ